MPMDAWQLEKIRSTVGNEAGDLRIKIYTKANETFKIWYNDRDNVSLYGREVFDETKKRERAVKAWREEVLHAINAEGTKVLVEHKGRSTWFGSESDMKSISDLYPFIKDLTKTEDSLDKALKHVTTSTKHRSFLIFSLPFTDGTARVKIANGKSRDTGSDILNMFKVARDHAAKTRARARSTEHDLELHLCIPMEGARIRRITSRIKRNTVRGTPHRKTNQTTPPRE